MSYVLNGISTPDAYTAQSTLDQLPACAKATINVNNASIYYQVKIAPANWPHPPGGAWDQEMQLTPGSYPLVRQGITGLRVRSAVPGTPAVVTAVVVPEGESG